MTYEEDEEQLEYRIKELHRKKLEKELEEISKQFRGYVVQVEESTQKRRRENIYVLFALGIVGAFFTFFPQDEIFINSYTFVIASGVFAFASLIFLVIKLNTVSFSPTMDDDSISSKVDNYSEYLFMFSVNGILILASIGGFISITGIDVQRVLGPAILSLATIMAPIIPIIIRNKFLDNSRAQKWQESQEFREEVLEELKNEIKDDIEALSTTNDRKEQLRLYRNISENIGWLETEGVDANKLDNIKEIMSRYDGIPAEMLELLQEEIAKIEEDIREDEERKSLEEQLEDLRQKRKESMEIANDNQY